MLIGQLALCLWTRLEEWPHEVESLREDLRLGDSQLFCDEALQGVAGPLIDHFKSANRQDGPKPPKRLKVLDEPPSNEQASVYRYLLAKINGSSENSPTREPSNMGDTILWVFDISQTPYC